MECVGTGFKQNAGVDLVLASNLQNLHCFGQKWSVWCIGVFERLVARAFGLV